MIDGNDGVRLTRTGCLYPCNLGPVMVVYPDAAWYCALTPRVLDRIVDEHFRNGQVVERYTRKPGRLRHGRPQPASAGDGGDGGDEQQAEAAVLNTYVSVAV